MRNWAIACLLGLVLATGVLPSAAQAEAAFADIAVAGVTPVLSIDADGDGIISDGDEVLLVATV
ncbi:MAG: hypothetical protein AAF125_17570, partial [Chloroflexota bacterium]